MSGVSFPIKRVGRALIVASPSSIAQPLAAMQAQGYDCAEVHDPYAAFAELCRRPMVYRAIVLSLAGLYREELGVISSIKKKLPHVDVWITHTEGRQAAMAEAIRLGADGLLADDGLHRTAQGAAPDAVAPRPEAPAAPEKEIPDDLTPGEPVLTADELRALLQEQPAMPPDIE